MIDIGNEKNNGIIVYVNDEDSVSFEFWLRSGDTGYLSHTINLDGENIEELMDYLNDFLDGELV